MLGDARRIKRWLPYALAGLLVLPPNVSAQEPAPPPQGVPVAQPATVQSLKVILLSGNQGMNDLESKVMVPLVVQVVDQSDQPVEGAEVTFRFPLDGPGASFANQKSSQTYRTNADGQAAAIGWVANGESRNLSGPGDCFPRQRTGLRDHFHDQRDPDYRLSKGT